MVVSGSGERVVVLVVGWGDGVDDGGGKEEFIL